MIQGQQQGSAQAGKQDRSLLLHTDKVTTLIRASPFYGAISERVNVAARCRRKAHPMMTLHFRSKTAAAQFVVAAENVTGQPPAVSRTEPGQAWRVDAPHLNPEEAAALFALLESRVPASSINRATMEQQMERERRARIEREAAAAARPPITARPLTPRETADFRRAIARQRGEG